MIPGREPLWAGEAVELYGEQQIPWGRVGDQELCAVNIGVEAGEMDGRSTAFPISTLTSQ